MQTKKQEPNRWRTMLLLRSANATDSLSKWLGLKPRANSLWMSVTSVPPPAIPVSMLLLLASLFSVFDFHFDFKFMQVRRLQIVIVLPFFFNIQHGIFWASKVTAWNNRASNPFETTGPCTSRASASTANALVRWIWRWKMALFMIDARGPSSLPQPGIAKWWPES